MAKAASRGVYWAYMVQCKYGTYYAGWTNNIKKRIAAHDNGTGAKYLRGKGPVKLVYKKKFSTVKKAQAQERKIKLLTRQEKVALIKKARHSERRSSYRTFAVAPKNFKEH